MANGVLLTHKDAEMISREYARMYGEIQGLLYLQKEIESYRESQREEL